MSEGAKENITGGQEENTYVQVFASFGFYNL